jgi:biotin carboxyl carrier protein
MSTAPASTSFDQNCYYTADPSRMAKWNNSRYYTWAEFRSGTGQEANGSYSASCPNPVGTPASSVESPPAIQQTAPKATMAPKKVVVVATPVTSASATPTASAAAQATGANKSTAPDAVDSAMQGNAMSNWIWLTVSGISLALIVCCGYLYRRSIGQLTARLGQRFSKLPSV